MNTSIQVSELTLGKHQFGRVDQRMKIGPITWPHHDLFWVHQGRIRLTFPDMAREVVLDAPDGLLILPGTAFWGKSVGSFATASVCHFENAGYDAKDFGYLVARPEERLHLQNQIRLAMDLAARPDDCHLSRRIRLLQSILDGFDWPNTDLDAASHDRASQLTAAWRQASDHIEDIRTLSDVARLAGVSESGFRKKHRETHGNSAGDYLRDLRLKKGEELLATTGFSVAEIAMQIGYRHAETFCAAFKKSRGLTAGQYRRWSKPFA